MSHVKSKNTKPEILFRKAIWAKGYRYRLYVKMLPGKPDVYFPKYKTVVFINGCFWHQHRGCKKAKIPETNEDFWEKKLSDNVQRDKRNYKLLKKMGYTVIVIWECQTKDIEWCVAKFEKILAKKS